MICSSCFRMLAFLGSVTLLVFGQARPVKAEQLTVVIRDQDGKKVDRFFYDKNALFNKYSELIYLPDNDQSTFMPTIAGFTSGYVQPRSLVKKDVGIMVIILREDGTLAIPPGWITSGQSQITLQIAPGRYIVSCFAPFQVVETPIVDTPFYTGTAIDPPPGPRLFEGVDHKGRYQFLRIEAAHGPNFYQYRYLKLYTYFSLASTTTFVSPGETDTAFVSMLSDFEYLADVHAQPTDHTIEFSNDPIAQFAQGTTLWGAEQATKEAFKHVLNEALADQVAQGIARKIGVGVGASALGDCPSNP